MKFKAATIATTLALLSSSALAQTYSYDAQGRVVAVLYGDGSRFVYTYDPSGNLLSVATADAGFADLAVTLAGDVSPVGIGETLTYTITVTNNGPDATPDTAVQDMLPPTLLLQSVRASQGSCSGLLNLTCDLGHLGLGQSATIVLEVEPQTVNALYNTASVSSNVTDPDSSNNSDSLTTLVVDLDTDGDGLFNSMEIAGSGDGNNDGIGDQLQANVANFATTTFRGTVTIVVGGDCDTIQNIVPVRAPDTHYYPYGLASFDLPCSSAEVTLYYSDAPELTGAHYRVYGPETPGDTVLTWFGLDVIFGVDRRPNRDVATARFTLQDGVRGDATGVDQLIVHPMAGPGYARPEPAVIPETQWDPNDLGIPYQDDAYVEYALPFTFPFFGRMKTAISVNTNGLIELLGPGESCQECENYNTYVGNRHLNAIDAIFTLATNLHASIVILGSADRVEIVTFGAAESPPIAPGGPPVFAPLLTSLNLYPDGRILLNVFEADYIESYYNRPHTAVYDRVGDVEVEIEGGSIALEQQSNVSYEYQPGGSYAQVPWDPSNAYLGPVDEDNVEFPFPFVFPYFNRFIVSANVSTNGDLELLEPGETCSYCSGFLAHVLDAQLILETNHVFAANDDLITSVFVRNSSTAVDVLWIGATFEDDSPENQIAVNLTFADDGSIDYKFFDMAYFRYSGDLFSGLYNPEIEMEHEVEDGSTWFTGEGVNTRFTFSAPSDIWVEKYVAEGPFVVGDRIPFTVVIGNDGPTRATDVQLLDILPMGLEAVSATTSKGSCGEQGGVLTCTLGDLERFDEVQVAISATARFPGVFTNTASVSTTEFDNNPYNDEEIAVFEVDPLPVDAELSVTLVDAPDPAEVDAPITFTATVRNRGLGDGTHVTITYQLPAGLTFVSAEPDQGSCFESAGLVTCDLGTVIAGTTVDTAIVATAAAAGTYTSEVAVIGLEQDPNPTNNLTMEETTVVEELPDAGVPDAADTVDGDIRDSGPAIDAGPLDGGLKPEEDEGCGCSLSRSPNRSPHGWLLLLILLLRRRRRRQPVGLADL